MRLWDVDRAQQAGRLNVPARLPAPEHSAVHALGETSGGELWAGHKSGSLNVWDAAAESLVLNLPRAHDGPIWGLARLPHGAGLMGSAGDEGLVRLWDVRTPSVTAELDAGCAVYALGTAGGGGGGGGAGGLSEVLLATGGYDGCLRLWDLRSSRLLSNLQAHRAPVRSVLVQCDAASPVAWSASTDGTLRCWDLAQLLSPQKQSPGRGLSQYIATGHL